MFKKSIFLFALIATLFSCKDEHSDLADGLYAEIETSKGTVIVQLEYEKTPITVANFVTLAEGKNKFVSEQFKGKPFYNGLKFHRVVQNFMIQGGDPLGNGSGDAGYKFKDEITDLTHSAPGALSMANSGPGTNSSQFFITHVPTPWLDGKHTVFGHVVGNGMEAVNKIVQDDFINSISIIRKGDAAKKFDAVKVFDDYFSVQAELKKKFTAERMALYAALKTGTKTASGLTYTILKKGSAEKPAIGTQAPVFYAVTFEDGTLLDTNMEAIAQKGGTYDKMRAAQGGYGPIPFEIGIKEGLVPGFIEAVELMHYGDRILVHLPSNIAYGEAGNGIVPPNTNLIFELEMGNKK